VLEKNHVPVWPRSDRSFTASHAQHMQLGHAGQHEAAPWQTANCTSVACDYQLEQEARLHGKKTKQKNESLHGTRKHYSTIMILYNFIYYHVMIVRSNNTSLPLVDYAILGVTKHVHRSYKYSNF
jgi:hypothetical protein